MTTATHPPISVAVLGAGHRFDLFKDLFESSGAFRLVAVADPNTAALEAWRDRLPGVELFEDHHDAISVPGVEAVAVSRKPMTRGWAASFHDVAGDFVVIEFPVFYR